MFGEKCFACQKPITDGALVALGNHWHNKCFVCMVSQIAIITLYRCDKNSDTVAIGCISTTVFYYYLKDDNVGDKKWDSEGGVFISSETRRFDSKLRRLAWRSQLSKSQILPGFKPKNSTFENLDVECCGTHISTRNNVNGIWHF